MPTLKKTSSNKPDVNPGGWRGSTTRKITSGTIQGTYSHKVGDAPGFKDANARKA